MNDPLWDLGDLSVEAVFDPTQDRELLEAYIGEAPTVAAVGRMTAYRAMCDLLWTVWRLVQHADGNPVEDFLVHATIRFVQFRGLMRTPDHPTHLEAISRGA